MKCYVFIRKNIFLNFLGFLFFNSCAYAYGIAKTASLEGSLDEMCRYIEDLNQLLNATERSSDIYQVAWVYGHLSARLSIGNDNLKTIMDSYNNGSLKNYQAKKLFTCLNDFIKKLSLSQYIYEHKSIKSELKNQYLPATEDIRSIMESGILLSFFMLDDQKPYILRDRFLTLYNKREKISDPINKLFDMLSLKIEFINSSSGENFVSQIPVWSQCDANNKNLMETLVFLNSLQRYLISGMFAEELFYLLTYQDQNQMNRTENHVNQMKNHRKDYRLISQSFTNVYSYCYLALQRKKEFERFSKASSLLNWNCELQGIIIYWIFILWFRNY